MLEKRIAKFELVQDFLSKNVSTETTYCLEKDGDCSFKIGDLFKLTGKIGTESKYGAIYRTVAYNDPNVDAVTKLMGSANKGNVNETRVNLFVTSLIQKKVSRHFLMCYKVFPECKPPQPNSFPDIIKKKKYFMVLNECADGDLKNILTQREFLRDTDMIFNIFLQCILSIATLHSYGFNHTDCHWGNFLFKEEAVDDNAYYHYKVYGKDYYLKACKYNMMICDFGLVKADSNDVISQNRAINDYIRLMPFFMLKEDKSCIDSSIAGVLDIKDSIPELKKLSLLSQKLDKDLFREHYIKPEEKNEVSVIFDVLDQLAKFQVQDVFIQNLPENIVGKFEINNCKNMKALKIPRLLKI